ncbi:hypothetical protein [Maricaulis salignorans]|uniref:Uncharacterized protein n=1 Tax=Maricaulis salignorans TaxID=144026 RepID=A0A1G9UB18_9PROT|nr:hypothetical protein [Maricaulis salignorans]SDM57042.1 hypothetical protein SAMN04488568_11463 [Maricaulis salignorans]
MVTLRDEFHARLDEFRPEYGFWEQDEVIRSLANTGELLDLIFVGDEAAMAMALLEKIIAKGTREDWEPLRLGDTKPDLNWRETWDRIDGWDASSTPPFLDDLHELNAFANFGIMTIWDIHADSQDYLEVRHMKERFDEAKNPPKWVRKVCEKIERFEALVGRGGNGKYELTYLPALREQALARIKLDEGEPLTVGELASLSGVSIKRLQNAIYAQSEGAPSVSKKGLIAPEACARWLNERDYRWSIWREVAAEYPLKVSWGEQTELAPPDPLKEHDDYVFVPVAMDGSIFSPHLGRGSARDRFTIGPKGEEVQVEGFGEAVERLLRMETPRWRRPNPESGRWGIVSGQSWKRVRRSELEALA